MSELLSSVDRLSRDLAAAAVTLSLDEARFLVDAYYAMQEDRIRADHQVRALTKSGEPHDVLRWLSSQSDTLEGQVKRALTKFAESHPLGLWPLSQIGIGPVITAGLIAHIDINKAPTAGHIWRFAGLDPTQKWEKGQKRPWNASLKTLCWKIGESFVKVSGNEDAYYGQVYVRRKLFEVERSASGALKEQAEAALKTKRIGKDTDAYKAYSAGQLPPAHIHARAKRYAVKLFLAHLHHVWFEQTFDKPPPMPYAIAQLGHAHYLPPPG